MTASSQPGGQDDPVTSRDFARGLGTTLLARLGGVIDVVSQPIYVWLFGLASYGFYAVLWAAVNLIENIADLGMTTALQRMVPQAKDEREAVSALRSALILGVVPCLAIAALATLAAPAIAPLFNVAASDQPLLIGMIRLFAWALPLWAFVEIATSALRARRVFGAEIRLRVFWEQLLRIVLAGALFIGGFGIEGLFIAHMSSLALISLLSVRLLARHYDLRLFLKGPLVSPVFFATFSAGLATLPANVVGRLLGDAPPIVLNAMLPGATGATAAALYTIARKVSSIVQLVRSAFSYVLAPLASSASLGGVEEIRPIYAFATRFAFALILPLGCVMAAGGEAILGLFGRGADAAHVALIILIVARMAEAVFGSAVPVQQVIGGYRQQIFASTIGLGIAALLVWPLVTRHGLSGMAIAMGAGFITAAIIPFLQLHRYSRIHPFGPPFARVAFRAALAALPALAIAIPAARLQPDVLQLPAVALIGLGALWVSIRFALPAEDRRVLGKTGRLLKLR